MSSGHDADEFPSSPPSMIKGLPSTESCMAEPWLEIFEGWEKAESDRSSERVSMMCFIQNCFSINNACAVVIIVKNVKNFYDNAKKAAYEWGF